MGSYCSMGREFEYGMFKKPGDECGDGCMVI